MALSPAFFAPPAALGKPVARRRPVLVALPAMAGVTPSREIDEAIQSPLAPALIFGTVAAGYAVAGATVLPTHLPALPLP